MSYEILNLILESIAKKLEHKSFPKIPKIPKIPSLQKINVCSYEEMEKALEDPDYFPKSERMPLPEVVYSIGGHTPIETKEDIERFIEYIVKKYPLSKYTTKKIFEMVCKELERANPLLPEDIKEYLVRLVSEFEGEGKAKETPALTLSKVLVALAAIVALLTWFDIHPGDIIPIMACLDLSPLKGNTVFDIFGFLALIAALIMFYYWFRTK